MVTISQAAQLTGVAEHTLRAWERRYGVFQPARTRGGYRDYGDEALHRIRAMQHLVASGLPPREASAELLRRGGAEPAGEPDSAAELIASLAQLDATVAQRIIDEQFALRSYEAVVDDWLMPTLVRVGEAWASGTISEAGEHLVANVVMRRLAAAFDAVGPNPPTPPAIVGAPVGVTHELGLLAFAVALRRAGVATIYLGADVPAPAWADAVATTSAVISITAIPRRADARRVAALAHLLQTTHPSVPLAVGGRFQHLAPPDARQLGHRIAAAAQNVSRSIAAP
ncbi:MAG: MerR family transcriptional regulator [Propionicimonas sp.]|uniref:MerR family transcriptional regulator n=1 Tax=Propionicimonas sp. TaxID=1955623 RepID=UPI002B1F557D|nr:MerR family transcriptional regulator [Propionicimonas sp.]MEA4944022.1 MerR family transcriptional regulator [Propionicimonas sp.]